MSNGITRNKPDWMTPAYLHEVFDYTPETGSVLWKHRPHSHFQTKQHANRWNACYAGKSVGTTGKDGYIRCKLKGGTWLLHRLIYLMIHAEYPQFIDHVNQKRNDNRATNLRAASASDNKANSPGAKHKQYRGVHRHNSGRYVAQVAKSRRVTYLGIFDSPEEAAAVYNHAAKKLHGEFAHSNRMVSSSE